MPDTRQRGEQGALPASAPSMSTGPPAAWGATSTRAPAAFGATSTRPPAALGRPGRVDQARPRESASWHTSARPDHHRWTHQPPFCCQHQRQQLPDAALLGRGEAKGFAPTDCRKKPRAGPTARQRGAVQPTRHAPRCRVKMINWLQEPSRSAGRQRCCRRRWQPLRRPARAGWIQRGSSASGVRMGGFTRGGTRAGGHA